MRKYCAGCGASLLKKIEDYEPEPVEEPEEAPMVETPVPEEVHIEPEEEEDDDEEVPESEPIELDKGKAVVADILEKVKAAEARTRGEEVTAPSETDMEPPPEETFEELDEPIVDEEPAVEDEVEGTLEDELESPPPEEIILEEPTPFAPIPEAPPSVSMRVDEPGSDEKVRMLESDISAFLIEREQLQLELDKLRTRLDEEVERYRTTAEVKRTRAESIERDLSLAKKEHSDASKEYKNADNHRKKELSNSEKRIRDVEKRIKKARASKEKRIRDLEKERRKREEEAR